MPLGLLFWFLMILWLVLGVDWAGLRGDGGWRPFGGSLLLFILLFIIGWKTFGFILSGT